MLISKIDGIKNILLKFNQPNFRLNQIFNAIFHKKIKKYQEITSLPLEIRKEILKNLGENTLMIKPSEISKSKQATKVLFELYDKNKIEAVYMKFKNGKTSLCISSQVGCALKCNFCATGAIGFKRQLTVDEITDQILYFQQVFY